MSKMFDRIVKGELPLGTILITNGGPEWVELLASVGFDFIVTDFMITSVTWEQAANNVRAAAQFGVTPWLRLQGYPWNGYVDARTVSDVLRALSIGVECVMMSIDSAEEVRAVLKPQDNSHRKVHVYRGDRMDTDPAEYAQQLARETLVVPHIESRKAAEHLEEILNVEGVRAIWLGMGDLSRQLGHPGQPTHPEMRTFVQRTVRLARERGVMVMANTGHFPSKEANTEAALWLWEAGVSAVWISYPEYVIQHYYLDLLNMIRSKAPTKSEAAAL